MPNSQGTTGDPLRAYWHVLSQRTIYTSPWINLHVARVELPDGSIIEEHHVLDYPRQAVGVVPVADDGRVLLLDQYRFITDTRGWAVPAGRIEPGETPEECARRELVEETGQAADQWIYLGRYHPSNGSSNQTFHVYVARGLQQVSADYDANEVIGWRWFSPEEVRQLIADNQVLDGLSLTSLLWALQAGHVDNSQTAASEERVSCHPA